MNGLGIKARCVDTCNDGIKPAAGLTPHCFWVAQCTENRRCFWAKWHQVTPGMKPRTLPAGQADLFASEEAQS